MKMRLFLSRIIILCHFRKIKIKPHTPHLPFFKKNKNKKDFVSERMLFTLTLQMGAIFFYNLYPIHCVGWVSNYGHFPGTRSLPCCYLLSKLISLHCNHYIYCCKVNISEVQNEWCSALLTHLPDNPILADYVQIFMLAFKIRYSLVWNFPSRFIFLYRSKVNSQ